MSVIIPAYNCGRFIAEAVESVLAQTYSCFEILVVDDGSTDLTRTALEPYLDRIRYVYQKNRGEPAARNTGMRLARGDFIAFLDADDQWLREKLELQMQYFEAHTDSSVVYTDMKIADETGIVHESVAAWLGMSPPSGAIFPQLFQETLFGSGSVVFRRECIDTVGLFDESFFVGCDYEMWLRMARHFRFGYVDRPLLVYRQHPGMASRGAGAALVDGIPWEVKVINKALRLYPEITTELGPRVIRKRRAKPYLYLGNGSLNQADHRTARILLSKGLRLWPLQWRYQLLFLATFLAPSHVSMLRTFRQWLRRLTEAEAGVLARLS